MNIVLGEDRKRVRTALRILLEQQSDWNVVGEASNAVDPVTQTKQTKPDLVLVDESLPGISEQQVLHTIREIYPQVRIVALIEPHSVGRVNSELCADAYATKVNSPDFLLSAIRMCLNKRSCI